MSALTEGTVGVSITAGHLTPTELPTNPVIGKGFNMGAGAEFTIHITKDVARQWIAALQTIEESNSA